jgi:hypothetical protein
VLRSIEIYEDICTIRYSRWCEVTCYVVDFRAMVCDLPYQVLSLNTNSGVPFRFDICILRKAADGKSRTILRIIQFLHSLELNGVMINAWLSIHFPTLEGDLEE